VGLVGSIYTITPAGYHANILNPPIIIELVFAALFLVACIMFQKRGVAVAGALFMFFVSMQFVHGFHYSFGDSRNPDEYFDKMQKTQLVFQPQAKQDFINFIKTHSKKAIVKYVDLVPGPTPFTAKNLSWFLLPDVKLSSYYGYDWEMGISQAYSNHFPVINPPSCATQPVDPGKTPPPSDCRLAFRPDWEWIRQTGADFVLFEDGALSTDPMLSTYVDLDPAKVYNFIAEEKDNYPTYTLAPTKFLPLAGDPVVFDNGYVRVRSVDGEARIDSFKTNNAGDLVFTIDSRYPATVEYLFWPNTHLNAAVDEHHVDAVANERLMKFIVPAGHHKFSMKYRRLGLDIFLGFYILYGIALSIVLGSIAIRRGKKLLT
jgi:hypothetical protein